MFGDINRVEVMGNITADPELRQTGSGTSVCSLGLATNRRYLQNEEWKEETEFHNLVFWGNKAEQIADRAKKGTRIYAEGRLQTRSWDAEDGSKKYKTEVVVNRFILIDRYEKSEYGGNNAQATQQNDTKQPKKTAKDSTSNKKSASKEEKIDPDDLPF